MDLAGSLYKDIHNLLAQILRDERTRHHFIFLAFVDTPILDGIDYSGGSSQFVTRLIRDLENYGPVDGKRPLLILLEYLQEHLNTPGLSDVIRRLKDTRKQVQTSEQVAVGYEDYEDEDDNAPQPYVIAPAILTIDIVEFSVKAGLEQYHLYRIFMRLLRRVTKPFYELRTIYWSPAGDGGALTIEHLPHALEIALGLAHAIEHHNQNHSTAQLQVRMGIHKGTVSISHDFDKRMNVWGPGINLASRIANLAAPGQILASDAYCEAIAKLRNGISIDPSFVPYGNRIVKHGVAIRVFNVVDGNVGVRLPDGYNSWATEFNNPLEKALKEYNHFLMHYTEQHHNGTNQHALHIVTIAKRILNIAKITDEDFYQQSKEIARTASQAIHKVARASQVADDAFYHFVLTKIGRHLQYFINISEIKHYKAGKTIFVCGDEADSLIFVVSGDVEIILPNKKRIFKSMPGSVVGEMGLFQHSKTRVRFANVHAKTDVVALSIPYANLLEDQKSKNGKKRNASWSVSSVLWEKVYTRHIIENVIMSHELFAHLNNDEKHLLMNDAQAYPEKFSATHAEGLDVEDLKRYAVIVFQGKVQLVTNLRTEQHPTFRRNQVIGLCRLATTEGGDHNLIDTIVGVNASSNVQIVKIDWEIILGLLQTYEAFRNDCIDYFNHTTVRIWGWMIEEIPPQGPTTT